MKETNRSIIFNKLSAFACTQCGTCCTWPGSITLEDDDLPRFAEHFGISTDAFIKQYTELAPNRRMLQLVCEIEAPCPLFDLKTRRCTTYQARPAQCRDFPSKWLTESGCPALEALLEED